MASLGQSFGNLLKGVGSTLSSVGTQYHLPQIVPGGAGKILSGFGSLLAPKAYAAEPSTGGQVLGTTTQQQPAPGAGPIPMTGTAPIAPATSGQGATSGGTGLTPPTFNPGPDTSSNLDLLRGQYANAAQDIQNQQAPLDQSYAAGKGDIQNAIDTTDQLGATQKQNNDQQYGDLLKQQVNTYRQLGQQRQGTFSALGTLDSSAYGDQQLKADQALSDDTGRTNLAKTQGAAAIDTQVNNFHRDATNQLANLAVQYQQGKNAISSALANNNLQEAGAIQSALDQVRQHAADIQNSIANFANQAQLYKSLGYNVGQNISGYAAQPFAANAMNMLGQYQQGQNGLLQVPTSSPQPASYIGSGVKKPLLPGQTQ